jgi:hypothetical protein
MPRVRYRSEAVDVDHGQLVGRHLNRLAVVMSLHVLAPVGGWAPGRREWWWLDWFAEVCENLPDRARDAPRSSWGLSLYSHLWLLGVMGLMFCVGIALCLPLSSMVRPDGAMPGLPT